MRTVVTSLLIVATLYLAALVIGMAVSGAPFIAIFSMSVVTVVLGWTTVTLFKEDK